MSWFESEVDQGRKAGRREGERDVLLELEAAGLRLVEYDNADGKHAELPRILRTLADSACA